MSVADGTIGVTEGTDKLLDTTVVDVAATSVHRERVVLASPTEGDDAFVRVMGEDDTFSATEYALVVQQMPARVPTKSHASATISVGGTSDFDTPTIDDTGQLSKLLFVSIGGPAPWQAQIRTVIANVEQSVDLTLFGQAGDSRSLDMPDKSFITVEDSGVGGGVLTGFRITVTNCDTGSQSSEFFVAMYWDQTNP